MFLIPYICAFYKEFKLTAGSTYFEVDFIFGALAFFVS